MISSPLDWFQLGGHPAGGKNCPGMCLGWRKDESPSCSNEFVDGFKSAVAVTVSGDPNVKT